MSDQAATDYQAPRTLPPTRTDTWVYEVGGAAILNETITASFQNRRLLLPQNAPSRLAAVQVTFRSKVVTGTGSLTWIVRDPQGRQVWDFVVSDGQGTTQDTVLLPLFAGALVVSTDETFPGAFSVGAVVFVSGYLRAGL